MLYLSASKGAKVAFGIPVKSEVLTVNTPWAEAVLSTCALMNNLDSPNATSDIFFLLKGAYKPTSFWNICGIPFPTPETWIALDGRSLSQTPVISSGAASRVTVFKSDEIDFTSLKTSSPVPSL